MRAVAVGMATTEGLPQCPKDCGGRIGGQFPELLTKGQRSVRELNGCDSDAAHPMFTITCPECDGTNILPTGKKCDYCYDAGALRGERGICRCAASHMTPEISDALRHYPHADGGAFPAPGGLIDQSPTFIQFVGVMGGEVAKVQREASEARRLESTNKSKAKSAGKR